MQAPFQAVHISEPVPQPAASDGKTLELAAVPIEDEADGRAAPFGAAAGNTGASVVSGQTVTKGTCTAQDLPPPTRLARLLGCCCPCIPVRRRRPLCCCLCVVYLLMVLGGCILAGVLVYKLLTELEFVLCAVSPCLPGDDACQLCLDPDAPCARTMDTWVTKKKALPMNITYVVYNPIFIPYTVERLVMHTSLEPLPDISADEMLAMHPLDGLGFGAAVACEAGTAHYTSGWGEELQMLCMSSQQAETIGRLNAVQKKLTDDKLHVRVAIQARMPVLGIQMRMVQDASKYADDFDFAAIDQPPAGLAACSEVSGVQYGAPKRVLDLYALSDYEVSICAPDAAEFAALTARTAEAIGCIASSNMLPGCWPAFRNGTFNGEELRVTIPVEMYNSAAFNLTLDVDGSEARVYEAETGAYVATGYLSETATIPGRTRMMLRYYADIRDFITRGTSHNGVLGLTVTSYRTLFETPVVLEIVSRATILGTTYNQQFALSHTSLIGLASLNGCRCEVGPDPKRCRTNASSYAAAAAASFGG